jgi:hypothetical protein
MNKPKHKAIQKGLTAAAIKDLIERFKATPNP